MTDEITTEKNVVYGMYSGTALLMDVYRPMQANGFGIVRIDGSGWHAPLSYDAVGLKEGGAQGIVCDEMLGAGYTLFCINHRAAPRFRYPAAVEDVQRAVRFIRHHASDYGITAEHIGGWGGSSGAHLVSMLATLDGTGDASDPDPVNRESSKIQCAVSTSGPSDFASYDDRGTVASFLGVPKRPPTHAESEENRLVRRASPISHVSAETCPVLLIHGDNDKVVPYEQSAVFHEALKNANVPSRLVRVIGGPHGGLLHLPTEDGQFTPSEIVGWFDTYLRG